ncbi:hypothetical protein ADJ67_02110 [Eubacterium sulci ATCC 35585]|nr:hypothetical protein ADJ67_02110 [Eubacterium sulci ATCC 35585]EUC77442.1 hypothetical protein HMPREF9092_0851 [Eubacterium sulci ATCC 35585]
MEKYKFTVTTSKSDIIIGLASPALFMLPILGINLAIFYLGAKDFIKENQVSLFIIVATCLAGAFALIKKIQQSLIKDYIVEIYSDRIRVWQGSEELLSGKIIDCKASIKMDEMNAKSVNLDIYTDSGNVKFRARAKEFRKITGVKTSNPLGTSEMSDMEEIYSLAQKIRM